MKTLNIYASTRSRAWPAEVAGRFELAALSSTTETERPASELGPPNPGRANPLRGDAAGLRGLDGTSISSLIIK